MLKNIVKQLIARICLVFIKKISRGNLELSLYRWLAGITNDNSVHGEFMGFLIDQERYGELSRQLIFVKNNNKLYDKYLSVAVYKILMSGMHQYAISEYGSLIRAASPSSDAAFLYSACINDYDSVRDGIKKYYGNQIPEYLLLQMFNVCEKYGFVILLRMLINEYVQEVNSRDLVFRIVEHYVYFNDIVNAERMLSKCDDIEGNISVDKVRSSLAYISGDYKKAKTILSKHKEDVSLLYDLFKCQSHEENLYLYEQYKDKIELFPETEDAAKLYIAFASLMDAEKEYQLASEYARYGNKILNGLRPYNKDAYQELVSKIENIEDWNLINKGASRLNPIFIVGMPRSGTTLLEQIIGNSGHVSKLGESPFFYYLTKSLSSDRRVQSKYPEGVSKIGSQIFDEYAVKYRELFGINGRWVEKMPDNFLRIGFIKSVYPDSKIIFLVRNKFDVVMSNYFKYYPHGNNWSYRISNIEHFHALHYRAMSAWLRLYPEDIISLSYEDMVQFPEYSLKKVFRKLDLNWTSDALNYFANVENIATASDKQVRRPLYVNAIGRWDVYKSFMGSSLSECY